MMGFLSWVNCSRWLGERSERLDAWQLLADHADDCGDKEAAALLVKLLEFCVTHKPHEHEEKET